MDRTIQTCRKFENPKKIVEKPHLFNHPKLIFLIPKIPKSESSKFSDFYKFSLTSIHLKEQYGLGFAIEVQILTSCLGRPM